LSWVRSLALTIIVIAVVGSSLLIAFTGPRHVTELTQFQRPYSVVNSVLAIEVLKSVISEARKLLPHRGVHGLAMELIEGSRIVNSSVVLVNGVAYRFIVVQAMDAEHGVFIAPKRVSVDGVSIELLPRSTSTTFTGGTQYTYLVKLGGRVCRVSFYFVGLQIAYANLVVDSESVCDDIYGVSIFVNPHLGSLKEYKGVFMLLIPVKGSR